MSQVRPPADLRGVHPGVLPPHMGLQPPTGLPGAPLYRSAIVEIATAPLCP